jgi:predicted outer membrane protein
VRARCDHAEQRVLANLDSITRWPTLDEKVMAMWFAAGVVAHLPLVAALRNPTVRRRFIDVRSVLSDAGRDDLYAELLALLGCSTMKAERARHHLKMLERAFDAAAAVVATPFAFAGDITPAARTIAIDGTRAMIEAGFAREAMFWLVATFTRCQIILHADARIPARHRIDEVFSELLKELGIDTEKHLHQRADSIRQTLTAVRGFADTWIDDAIQSGPQRSQSFKDLKE